MLDRDCTLLFRRFERRYPYLLPVMPSAEECLLVPFYVGGRAVGTIWAIMHSDRRKFDAEDERLTKTLGQFASLAYQTVDLMKGLRTQYEALLRETAAKEEAQRSEESHRRWAEVTLASIGDAVITTDAEGRVNFLNSVAATLTGWSAAEAAGNPISGVFHIVGEGPGDAVESPIPKILDAGEAQTLPDSVLVSKSGKRTPIADSAAPIRDLSGRLIGAVVVFRNITERKQREQALRRSNEDLQRFAFAASHDLEQPLRTVAGFVGLLNSRYRDRFDAEGVKFIQFALDGAQRMQTLISDLLQYSRLGAQALRLAPTDLNSVADAVQADVGELTREAGAVVRRDPLPTVTADPTKIREVLQNLLLNSLKFRSDRRPEIHITSELRGNEWVIGVHDNGIGFEPQYAERVFGMFERLHSASKYPGSGIGLALCKRVVEEQGGRIWAESKPGIGSSFYFTLAADSSSAIVPEG